MKESHKEFLRNWASISAITVGAALVGLDDAHWAVSLTGMCSLVFGLDYRYRRRR